MEFFRVNVVLRLFFVSKAFSFLRFVVLGNNTSFIVNNRVVGGAMYIKNNTWARGEMKFIFSCSTRYLTRSLRSLVRYRD